MGMFGFVALAYNENPKNQIWIFIWIISALLINPFFKIALGREIWNIVDIVWAVIIIISLVNQGKNLFARK